MPVNYGVYLKEAALTPREYLVAKLDSYAVVLREASRDLTGSPDEDPDSGEVDMIMRRVRAISVSLSELSAFVGEERASAGADAE